MRNLVIACVLAASVSAVAAGNLQEELLQRERVLWQAWGNKDGNAFRTHLPEDHVQVVAGVGVVAGGEAIASAVEKHDCEMSIFGFSDVTLRQPVSNVAILSYVASQETTCGGQALPARVFATSVYVRKGGRWTSTMYQETPLD